MKPLKNPTDSGKSLAVGFQKNTDSNNTAKSPKVKPGTKEYLVLSALVTGKSYNRFDAERELFDHCLKSTVSTLQGKGISIHRESEKVPCMGGEKLVDVKRYCLLPSEIEKAQRLLGVAT